ncbi:MAG: hypothetical protein E7557_04715 [Ruminococcaceae bacterium]|nr:hypothetical protein [Oscillospiraceae bacterium]
MKKFVKKTMALILLLIMTVSCSIPVYAKSSAADDVNNGVQTIEYEEDMFADAELIEETTVEKDGRVIVTKKYLLENGDEIIDTIEHSSVNSKLRSTNGSDSVTRTISNSSFGTVKLRASFKWWKNGLYSYVRCTNATGSCSVIKDEVKCSTSKTIMSSGDITIGKAYAEHRFYFYWTKNPAFYWGGGFKISCSDTGTISDSQVK